MRGLEECVCMCVCLCVCVRSLLYNKEVKSNLELMRAVFCPFNPNQLATGPHTPIKVNGRENRSVNHREINRNKITFFRPSTITV